MRENGRISEQGESGFGAITLDLPSGGLADGIRGRGPTHRAGGFLLRRLLLVGDAVAIMCALLVSFSVFGVRTHPTRDLAAGLLLLPLWVLLFKIYGLYDRDTRRISHSTLDEVPWVFHALVFGALALWTCFRVAPLQAVDLSEGIAFFAIGFAGVLLARTAVRQLLRRISPSENVLLVADGPLTELLVRKMRVHPEYRLEPVGYLEAAPGAAPPANVPRLGTLAELESVCATANIERVVAGPTLDPEPLIDLVRRASGMSVPVSLVPSVVDVLGPSVEIDDVEGITVLAINPPLLTRSSQWLKRGMDLLIATIAAVALLPAMAVTVLLIKLTSPGPVLFVQERVGRNGRRFRLYKFRTMVNDAEAKLESLRPFSADPHWLLLEHDPRVTRVGRILRSVSLDELPQLWNVIKGDMSLVGPRPLTPADHAQVAIWGRRRLDLTPGITGVWQVLGRTRIPFEEMVKLDYLYVTNWSLWGDVRLLIRTLPSVLRRRGAN
jgi:exopolysaccharide biosynthesis polyprenyl glycosylphosphotransferase